MSAKKLFNAFKIFILISILAFSSKTFAQIDLQCEPVPDCVTLGYQQEVECPNGAYVNCPFDASYKKCVNQNCIDLGFSATDKSRWCKKIVTCPTDLAYTLCDELDPCASYNLTLDQSLTYDAHCYNCKVCNSGSGNRYKCTEQLQAGYYVIDGVCTYNPCDGYDIDSATYLATYASEPEVHCQKCESCVTPEGPTVYKCDNSTPDEGYFVAANGTCSKDACFDYRLPERLDVGDAENCYDCDQCQVTGENAPLYGGYWRCTVHEENDYHLVGTECIQDPCPGYNVTQAQYESKYGSEDGQHCYDCQKCNNEDSTHNGNWKCTEKQNIESPYSVNGNGECVSDPCAGYDMTQTQKNSFLAQGDNSHCYDCRRCTIRTSEFYNNWNCDIKNPIDDHYRLIGEVCEPDPCIDYDITPEQYSSTYSKGDYSKCFDFTPCQDSSSDFYGYYKRTVKPSSTFRWGYYIEGDQCLKDPCYDDYTISNIDINNYDDHCYDCEKCPYSPSGYLENYHRCIESPDLGYELVNGRCIKQPCADYKITDIDSYTQNMGPYWTKCIEFEKCDDPNAPDEFKNNYKITFLSIEENGYTWSINKEGQCSLCGGLLCINKAPGDEKCSAPSVNATFYENCSCVETCDRNEDVTINGGTCHKPTTSSSYVKIPYSCTTCYNEEIYFTQYLNSSYCYKDCQGNCNPLYDRLACKAYNPDASYCFGTDSKGIRCNAISDPGCTPKKYSSYYWCDSCNDTYQCELMNGKYYDDDGSQVPSRTGCSLKLLPNNHCASSYPSPSPCSWTISGTIVIERGIYFVDDVCSKNGKNMVYTASCTQKADDCAGGTPPAYNRKTDKKMVTCTSSQTPYTYAYDSNGELLYDEDNNLVKLYEDEANPVHCGGEVYYDGCESSGSGSSCTETCFSSCSTDCPDFYNNNSACRIVYTYGSNTSRDGYETYQKKCTETCSSYSYWYMTSCTINGTGCDGNNTPYANGFTKTCPATQKKVNGQIVCQDSRKMEYVPVSDYQDCGGKRYASDWKAFCNYDTTADDCEEKGLCLTSDPTKLCWNTERTALFGECVPCS